MMDNSVFQALTGEELLSLLIYGEARGESRDGKIAVAWVVMNRVHAERPGQFGIGIKGVCLHPWQFSCFNAKDPNRQILVAMAKGVHFDDVCLEVANGVVAGEIPNPVECCFFYERTGTGARWEASCTLVKTVGHQAFYREG